VASAQKLQTVHGRDTRPAGTAHPGSRGHKPRLFVFVLLNDTRFIIGRRCLSSVSSHSKSHKHKLLAALCSAFLALAGAIVCAYPTNAQSAAGSSPTQSSSAQSGAALPTGQIVPLQPANTPSLEEPLEEAKALRQKGAPEQAEAIVRQYLASHADSADGHFLLGHILFEELQQKFAARAATDGESFRYSGGAGGSLAETRDAKARESLAEFSAGSKYRDPSAADLRIVALDYILLKDNKSAERWLALALKQQPDDAEGWYFLGRTRYSQDEFVPAIEAFERCLKLEPRNAVAEANVGLAYEGLNQKDAAMQAYQNAVTWEEHSVTKSPEPYLFVGRLYLSENQPELAAPYLARGAADFPDVAALHEQLGKAYSLVHQLPEAQEQLEKAAALEPNMASTHFLLGQVYRQLGMMEKAAAEVQRAEELNGTHSSSQPVH
jgi:tetratricopeptide (TPR) repeat protein